MRTTHIFLRTILFCLFAMGSLQAQSVSTDYATQINSVFANLDKTKVPHKLLIDYAMEFAELSAFNGTLTADNALHRGTYTEIYNTLLMARVQTNVTGLVNPTTFRTNWENLRQKNKIVLSGLYYKYNQFKTNASPTYVTVTNNKLYDKYVNGVWQNPYDEKQVFAMCTPILKYNSLSMQVELPSSLWYTNQAASVQSIAIDFNDGLGYQTVTLGQIKTVTYTQPGIKEWKYKLTLTNSQVLYSHSKLQIDAEIPPVTTTTVYRTINQPCSVNGFGVDQIDNFPGTRQYLNVANTATLEIDYAGTNGCGLITKPLIIVEGFDSGIQGVENPLGESDYAQFKRTMYNSLSTNLPSQINTYDIIYVNWNKGKDYLQRNAYLLEDIIKWVNAQKLAAGSNTPNVIIGQSMGGVIARYALRDMENRSEAHQTSLYISHDAPHQGANIPLSILYFTRHLGDQFIGTPLGDMNINPGDGSPVSIEDLQALLNAPGTKQLLMNNVNTSFTIDNSFATAWQTELRNLGYPQQTRNIAISNGSHCASPQEFLPNATLFSLSGNGKTSFLTSFLIEILGPLNALNDLAFVSLAVLFNEPGLLIGILPGNSKFNLDFNAKALPSVGTTAQIYKGKLTFTKKLFWIFSITVTITNRSFNNPSGILSYDYYPGGKYPVLFNFENSSASNAFFSYGITAQIADNFNFIPTPSALDIGRGSVALTNSDYFVKYNSQNPPVAPKDSPFANFTTSFTQGNSLNENHISFNKANGNWLAAEIDNISNNNQVFDCRYTCADNSIIGPDTFCTTGTYTAPPSASVTYYYWYISEGDDLVSMSANGTSSLTLNYLGNGFVTINLVYGDNNARCGNVTLTKRIHIGGPTLNSFTCGPLGRDFCSGAPVEIPSNTLPILDLNDKVTAVFDGLTASEASVNANWDWQPLNANVNINGSFGIRRLGLLNYGVTGIQVRAKNSCGWSAWYPLNFELVEVPGEIEKMSTSPMPSEYVVYPNPAKDVLYIDVKDQNNVSHENSKITGELYDILGVSKSKVEIKDNKAILSVKGLSKGIYVLKIFVNDKVETHQIAVE